MKIAIARGSQAHERAFLDAFTLSAQAAGHQTQRLSYLDDTDADVCVVWGAAPINERPTIHVEAGWLPRWHFQVSHGGINAEHHLAQPQLDHEHGKPGSQWRHFAGRYLQSLRERLRTPPFQYLKPRCECPVPPEFILAPMQSPADTNMKYVPYDLDTFARKVIAWSPLPVLFKQHPATAAATVRYETPHPHRWVTHKEATIYGLLRRPECRAVVTLNSNTANDSLLYDVPAIVLGKGIWPRNLWPTRLVSWNQLLRWHATHEIARWAYVSWLAVTQWRIADARSPECVGSALRETIRAQG